jgi:hypothetical protein
VTVLIVIAALVIVAGVVFVAIGRGGELSVERSDYAPLDLGPVSATDVVLLRPPTALWGYNVQATDEAFERIAESIRERDVRIVALEQRVTDLSTGSAAQPADSPNRGVRHRTAALEARQAAGGAWQAGHEADGGWQNGTEAAPSTDWGTEAAPSTDRGPKAAPTADWSAPSEQAPEQSHD